MVPDTKTVKSEVSGLILKGLGRTFQRTAVGGILRRVPGTTTRVFPTVCEYKPLMPYGYTLILCHKTPFPGKNARSLGAPRSASIAGASPF
jgi:hypothetical protein